MANLIIEENIFGKYVYITKMNFPLRDLSEEFSSTNLKYIFGEDIVNPFYFEEIENDVWSTHLVFKFNQSNKFAGYLRIVAVKGVIEVHGGGLNNTLIEKIALTEAWVLIIKKCFQFYAVDYIYTSCMINNKKAFKIITGTGFKEISRDFIENRIIFKLYYFDFINNRKLKLFLY